MSTLRRFFSKLVSIFNRRQSDDDLNQELQSHLHFHIDENLRRGMTPEQARRHAIIKLGGIDPVTEAYRDQRGLPSLETIWQDLRFGLRMLRKHSGFTTVAALTLAIGIGASAAVFSIINGVILQPLPFPDPDRLVLISTVTSDSRTTRSSYGAFADWQEQCAAFDALAVYDNFSCLLNNSDGSEKISATRVSPAFFSILRATPALGAPFTEQDATNRARLVILSHGLWQRRFASNPAIIGESIEIDSLPATIVGVMPSHFVFPSRTSELWQLQPPETPLARGVGPWFILGRLKPGQTPDAAQTQLQTAAARIQQAYPATNRDLSARLTPLAQAITGSNQRLALWIFFGAVTFVLLIGCSNLANLLLVRGVARRRELTTRLALGASRARVARQLILESLPIGALGGIAGVALAHFLIQSTRRLAGTKIPRLDEVTLDPIVVCFALALTGIATLLFAAIPAIQLQRLDVNESLKEGARSSGGRQEKSLRNALLVAQVALAFTLLFGAGLLFRSFQSVRNTDLGFDPQNLLTIGLRFPQMKNREETVIFYRELSRRLQTFPGVQAVGLIEDVFGGGNTPGRITTEDTAAGTASTEFGQVRRDSVTPTVFDALGAPIVRGRPFDERDLAGALSVAIINETMARRLWPGKDSVGKRFKLGPPDSAAPWLTVVGVVRDMRRERFETEPIMQAFRPNAQFPSLHMQLLVKTHSAPLPLADAIRQEILALDKTIAVYAISTIEQQMSASLFERKFQAGLLIAFSTAALFLAALGTYGIVRFTVQQRTREIGVRIALGAQKIHVLTSVIKDGLKLILAGVILGIALALCLTRSMQNLLFQVSPLDPLTFLVVALILGAVALLACWLPARRAAHIHPTEALREH